MQEPADELRQGVSTSAKDRVGMSKDTIAISPSKRRTVAGIAWTAWFALLLGTPFFLARPHVPPAASALFAYIAVGLAFGSLTAEAGGTRPRCGLLCILAGGSVMTVFAVLPEWVALPVALSEGFGVGAAVVNVLGFDLRLFLETVQPMLLFAASGLCGFSLPSVVRLFNEGKSEDSAKTNSPPYLALVSFLVLGFLHSATMAFSLGVGNGLSFVGEEWPFSAARPIVWMPFLLSAATAALLVSPFTSNNAAYAARFSGFLLVAYSVGLLAWNVLSRTVAVYSPTGTSAYALLSFLACSLVVVLCLSCLVAFRRDKAEKRKADEKGCPAEDAKEVSAFEKRLFVEAGLTDREVASVKALLRGRTSSQIASMLGVSPSTVRTYLQRSYRKLNVQNAAQLKELAKNAGQPAAEENPAEEQCSPPRPRACQCQPAHALNADVVNKDKRESDVLAWLGVNAKGFITAVLCLGPLVLVGVLFLPYRHHLSIWGAGSNVVLGGGLGLLVASLFMVFGTYVSMFKQDESEQAQGEDRLLEAARTLVSVVLLVVGCFACQWAEGTFGATAGAFVLVAGAVLLEASLCKPEAFAGLRATHMWVAAGLFLVLAFVALRVFEFRQMAVMAMLLMTASCAALARPFRRAGTEVKAERSDPGCTVMHHAADPSNPDLLTGALAAFVFLVLGSCFYGFWLYSYSHIYAVAFGVLFFSAAVTAGAVGVLRGAKAVSMPALALAIAAAVAVSIAAETPAFFLVAAVAAVTAAAVMLVKEKVVSPDAVAWVCLWIGFGLLAGVVGANLLTDGLFYSGVATSPFESTGVTGVAVSLAVIIGAFVSGAACVVLFSRLDVSRRRAEQKASFDTACSEDESLARRMNAFLVSQGLTPLQVAVVEGLASGCSLGQIAQETNYSKSAIMAAKVEALRRLRISNSENIGERVISCITGGKNGR